MRDLASVAALAKGWLLTLDDRQPQTTVDTAPLRLILETLAAQVFGSQARQDAQTQYVQSRLAAVESAVKERDDDFMRTGVTRG